MNRRFGIGRGPATWVAWSCLLALSLCHSTRAALKLPPVRQSEQFTVVDARTVASSFPGRLKGPNGEELVLLDADVLLLSAERIKDSLWKELHASTDGAGKIRLALYPALKGRQEIALISSFSPSGWDYRLDVPDQVSETTLAKGLVQALLLEYANRGQGPKSADLPMWLVEGLTWHLASVSRQELIVSSVPLGSMFRVVREHKGIDPLHSVRQTLRAAPLVSFSDLAYPKPERVTGENLKVYEASAQLFVYELLHAKDGAAKLLRTLRELPTCWNWETALLRGFAADFHRILDVEKKWSVDLLAFTARDPAQVWSKVECLKQLDEILSVPAQIRLASDRLPERRTLTLQEVLTKWEPAAQTSVLRQKLALLEVLRFHATPDVVNVVEGYHKTLFAYLQKRQTAARTPETRMQTTLSLSMIAQETIRELEQLDRQRSALQPESVVSGASPITP